MNQRTDNKTNLGNKGLWLAEVGWGIFKWEKRIENREGEVPPFLAGMMPSLPLETKKQRAHTFLS